MTVLQVLLIIHIFAAILLIGNLVTAAFWKVRANRSGNLEHIASTAQALIRSDYAFTAPGLAGLLVTGIVMGGITGWRRFEEPWLAASFLLIIVIAIIWLAGLVPQQRRMARLAQSSLLEGALNPAYRRAGKLWSMFGGLITLISVVILFLMVLKPGA